MHLVHGLSSTFNRLYCLSFKLPYEVAIDDIPKAEEKVEPAVAPEKKKRKRKRKKKKKLDEDKPISLHEPKKF